MYVKYNININIKNKNYMKISKEQKASHLRAGKLDLNHKILGNLHLV